MATKYIHMLHIIKETTTAAPVTVRIKENQQDLFNKIYLTIFFIFSSTMVKIVETHSAILKGSHECSLDVGIWSHHSNGLVYFGLLF